MHGSGFLLGPVTDLLALGVTLPIGISFIPVMPLLGCALLNSCISGGRTVGLMEVV